MKNQIELRPQTVQTITKSFPDPLAPVGAALRLGGVDYVLVAVRHINDGNVEHDLRRLE